jgi:SAM-dependent methyltransferase
MVRRALTQLREVLTDPEVVGCDPDSVEFAIAHRKVVQRKPMVRDLFASFYAECRAMDLRHFGDTPGARLEIGSGSSFMADLYPDVIATDVVPVPFAQVVLSAEEMPFGDGTLRSVYGINVFHHLSQPRRFFRECNRVLRPGGGVVLIEPYYGPLARFVFRNLHGSERFDPSVPSWEAGAATGPMSGANQALSWVVFTRDRRRFEREYPELELVVDRPHTHLRYLLSGGVNFRQLIPSSFGGAVAKLEEVLAPFNRWLALQHTIVLRRLGSSEAS